MLAIIQFWGDCKRGGVTFFGNRYENRICDGVEIGYELQSREVGVRREGVVGGVVVSCRIGNGGRGEKKIWRQITCFFITVSR